MNREMYFVFMRTPTLGSLVIQGATWSPWSHVACVLANKRVIESTAAHKGVRETTLDAVLVRASAFQFGHTTVTAEAERFLLAQVGKPYDWTALAGIYLHRDWQQDDAWFCSELAAATAQAGGRTLIRRRLSRVTPVDLYDSPLVYLFGANEVPRMLH